MHREGVCLIGYGETPVTRDRKPIIVHMAQAIKMALDNAGLKKEDVRGFAMAVLVSPELSPFIAEQLGLELDWILRADCGGASGVISVRRAADAIQLGEIDVAVCVGSGVIPSEGPVARVPRYQSTNFVQPYGYGGPNSEFALTQRRHMAEYGTTLEQLGRIAVSQRKNAEQNNNALFRSPLTIDDYLNSRIICDPIRLYDCVRPASGSAAVVMTSERKALELTAEPIYLVTDCEKTNYRVADMLVDRTTLGYTAFADELFSKVSREEIDFAQIYDDYPIAVLIQLEDLGFCLKGKGGEFIDNHDITFSGDFPINTGGGELSVGQAGLGGAFLHIVEAVRQLKGEAGSRQVKGARTGLVTGLGLFGYHTPISCAMAMILQRRTR